MAVIETFTGTDGDPWPPSWDDDGSGSGTTVIQGNKGRQTTTAAGGYQGKIRRDIFDATTTELTGEFTYGPGCYETSGGVGMWSGTARPAIEFGIAPAYGTVGVGENFVQIASAPFATAPGDTVHWRISFTGTSFKVNVWLNGDPEPAGWTVTATATVVSPSSSMDVFLWNYSDDSGSHYIDHDNLETVAPRGAAPQRRGTAATSLTTTITPPVLSVGDVPIIAVYSEDAGTPNPNWSCPGFTKVFDQSANQINITVLKANAKITGTPPTSYTITANGTSPGYMSQQCSAWYDAEPSSVIVGAPLVVTSPVGANTGTVPGVTPLDPAVVMLFGAERFSGITASSPFTALSTSVEVDSYSAEFAAGATGNFTIGTPNGGQPVVAVAISMTNVLTTTAPATPAAPSVQGPYSKKAIVTWVAPDDGGSAITGYTLQASKNGGAYTTVYTGNTLTQAITGLDPHANYTFKVLATNANGSSLYSAASASTTPYDSREGMRFTDGAMAVYSDRARIVLQ